MNHDGRVVKFQERGNSGVLGGRRGEWQCV